MWALSLVAVLSASGCGHDDKSAAKLAEPTAFLTTQAAYCTQTGGVWQSGWVHCVCPARTLFSPDRGCRSVPWSAGVRQVQQQPAMKPNALRRALRSLLQDRQGMQVTLDANALSDAALQSYATALRGDPASVLRGLTLAPARSEHSTVWILTPPDAASRQEVEREVPVGPGQIVSLDPLFAHPQPGPLQVPPLPAVDPGWLDAVWWGDPSAEALKLARTGCPAPLLPVGWSKWRCEEALSATAMPLSTVTQLCLSAQAAWRHLQDPSAAPWPLGDVQRGFHGTAPCRGECALAVQFGGGDMAVYYSVVLADGVPVRRVLRAGSPLGHELMLFLSPSGSIDSVVAKTRHVPVDSTDPVLRRNRWLFDRAWNLVRHDADGLGDQTQFNAALVGWQGVNHLATDSAPRSGSAVAVMIDTGVDPRLPGLRHRMQLPYGTTLLEHLLPLNTFTALGGSPSLRALTLFDERGHGTRVAARLLANLPGARLHVLRGDDLGFVPAPQLQARWLQALQAARPQVVNVSQDFSRLLPDCDGFFGPLVAALPYTLFVAGAGNGGAASAAGVCPASLASRHANMLSVAGSNDRGTDIDPASNYGLQVSVAAPMQQATVAFGSSEAASFPGTLTTAQGTSFAAAAVSNLALVRSAEAALQGRSLSGAALAAELMAACTPSGLDVQCGGALGVPP